jgi:hypothetical protein
MDKNQFHVRLHELAVRQLEELAARMRMTKSEAVSLGIERLHREVFPLKYRRGQEKAK